MKSIFVFTLVVSLALVGCGSHVIQTDTEQPTAVPPTPTQTPIPSGLVPVEIKVLVAKMVERPVDRNRDFTVITLDGSYTVYFDPKTCMTDNPSYMYGPYNSVKHCVIDEPGVLSGIVGDQAWVDSYVAPFKAYLNCLNGWVYLGVDESGEEKWFIELFGFPAFCR